MTVQVALNVLCLFQQEIYMPPVHVTRSIRNLAAAVLVSLFVVLGATSASAQDAPNAPLTEFAIPSAQVLVTGDGLLPAFITVTVGAEVFWTNNAGQEVRLTVQEGSTLYLPLVAAGEAKMSADITFPPIQPAQTSWTSDPIAPGGQYSFVFNKAGKYALYTSHLQGQVGTIVVLSDTLAATVLVNAETGGVVQAGGSRLEIPPGALAQDTTVVVSEPISGMSMAVDGMKATSLEPSGLQFSQPAMLTISYGDTGSYDEELLEVVAFNEVTNEWERQKIVAQDTGANTVVVQVEHFSNRFSLIDDPLYVVMQIPGKFLKSGSVLMRMNGGHPNCNGQAIWLPGHTGMFGYAVGSETRIVEANSGAEFIGGCKLGGDVHVRTLDEFITESCGFYMGAMYKEGASSEQMRNALTVAQNQLGKGYFPVGQGNSDADCFSCVGLVEYAYDESGASIIPDGEERPAITPLQQYRKLRPVNEITLRVGEKVTIPVYGINLVGLAFNPDHYERTLLYPTAFSLPSGSTYSGGVFEWTPQATDGGKSYQIQFKLDQFVAGKQRTVTQTLKINVKAPESGADEVLIPAGPFEMGCYRFKPTDLCFTSEQPVHKVNLSAYYIDKYEVTNARYKTCVDAGACTPPKVNSSHERSSYYGDPTYADYPVVKVSWNQAKAFCTWEGKRLPTEAEWEKAARGTDKRIWPWGNNEPDCSMLNFNECNNDTTRVGSYPSSASPYGVMDMAGNVWEWVNDWYQPDYYKVSPETNPQGPDSGKDGMRSGRSGYWYNDSDYVRIVLRGGGTPDLQDYAWGFRCARSQ